MCIRDKEAEKSLHYFGRGAVLCVAECAVFQLRKEGVLRIEIASGVDPRKDILNQTDFAPYIAEDLKLMDARIFREEKMGLAKE